MLRRGLFFLFLLGSMFVSSISQAEKFDIASYDIYMKVSKDKTVDVYEIIQADFREEAHGIYRDIPLKNSEIKDVKVDNNFTTEISDSNLRVKIGSRHYTVIGLQRYVISYKHHLYGRGDEFYYNIVGTEWPVDIRYVSFRIEMPEKIDVSKVGISIGEYGTVGFDGGAEFSVRDNIITGRTLRKLEPYEGITIRLELPQGYFAIKSNPRAFLGLLAIVLLSLLSFSIWFLYGRDRHITPVVTFYPPKDVFVRETELICTEKVTTKSLVAMIISLAQQGYIRIVEEKGKGYELIKLKDYDGSDVGAIKFMEMLFSKNGYPVTRVSQEELEESTSFYKKCEKLVNLMNSYRTKFFSPYSVSKIMSLFMCFLCVVIFLLTIWAFNHYYIGVSSEVSGEIFQVIFIVLFARGIGVSLKTLAKRLILPLIAGLIIVYLSIVHLYSLLDESNIAQVIFGVIGSIVSLICYIQLPQLNFLGQQMKGQLLGLKKFIEVAEKNKLEMMVEDNPEYFYEILPYAYILGVSDKWIKQFENIVVKKPEWYAGKSFTGDRFNLFAKSMYQTTIPTETNGGISHSNSGGGGFSGGGHGGGGGGSW